MRSFVVGWLLAFCAVGLAALGIGLAIGPATGTPPPTAVVARSGGSETAEPFSQRDAVDVIAARFPSTERGQRYRDELRQSARVSYHSPQHWTVSWGNASWTAHGPGRYAEPDNDAARRQETEAAGGS
jgi:hypothetical protein